MAEPVDESAGGAENIDAVEEKSKGGSMMMILLPLMLLSGGGGAYLAYSQYPTIVEMRANMEAEDEEESNEEAPIEYGEFMELTNIVVNPANSNGRRLLMLSLGIESADPAHLADLETRQMVVRDTIMKVLGRRTVDELASIELRSTLKQELIMAVNSVLTEGEIQRMYFTQFVIQ